MGSTLLPAQAVLIHSPCEKDIVYTPPWLAADIIGALSPSGRILDPCRGGGAFYEQFPSSATNFYCEIEEGIDFFAWSEPVDWVIGNPPYSNLLGWFRHGFSIADNVCFLVPLHRVVASGKFLNEVMAYGGFRSVVLCGTGSDAGFPFGHALAAVHVQRGFCGGTQWQKVK